jgi:subtilase family serine protease
MRRSRRHKFQFRAAVDRLDQRCLLNASGLSPAQLSTAYGLAGLTFGTPAVVASGAGQTIAVVEFGDDPNIQAELATFDATYNLPAPPSLKVVGQTGTSALPRPSLAGSQEEALDVEWAHALAPGASLVVVEANSSATADLIVAVQTAAALPGVSVVSMSFSGLETTDQTASDRIFTVPGVTFIAASGDDGFFGGAEWPASSPYVVGVGGTSLQVDASGNYLGETPWHGTSAGLSGVEIEPGYQQSVQTSGWRSTPDVAFDGDPNTGVQVYMIDPSSGQGSWHTVAGTSLGAPAWSAIVALADQGRALAGAAPLGSLQTLTTLYSLPSSDFHVINGGYNTLTGLGSPNGAALVDGLVSTQASAATTLPPGQVASSSSNVSTLPGGYFSPIFGFPIFGTPVVSPISTSHKHARHHKPVHTKAAPTRVVHPKAQPAAQPHTTTPARV